MAGDTQTLTGLGWWCTCPACRLGEPTPAEALAALIRAASVTIVPQGQDEWLAWTRPDSRYIVARAQGQGGWCKHILAVALHDQPLLRPAAIGAAELQAELKSLQKENRRLERCLKKYQKQESPKN